MRIDVESTSQIIEINGEPLRIFEGVTSSGLEALVYVRYVGTVRRDQEAIRQLHGEALVSRKPSRAALSIPLRCAP